MNLSYDLLLVICIISLFSDGLLSLAEFAVLCRALFRNDKGHIYTVPDDQIDNMFSVFDKNQDGFIDRDEFSFCWHHWIKTVSFNLHQEKTN